MNFILMRHQSEAIDFVLKNLGIAALFHEVGCGKTLSALMTFKKLRDGDPNLRLLVFCPISLIYGAWTREIEKFTEFSWRDLHSGVGKQNADIHLINFESVLSLNRYNELVNILKEKWLRQENWMCVIDESSRLKNHQAKTVQKILELRRYFKHRIIMSGTPAPNIEWEYWAQMLFLNENIFGIIFHKFKNTFFSLKRGNQILDGQYMNRIMLRKMHEQGFQYEINPTKKNELFERMRPWCHYAIAKECLDLPEEIDEFRVVEMTPSQTRIYNQMKNNYIAEFSDSDSCAVANIVLVKLMKLRQITAGFVIDDADNALAVDTKNPKLDALLEIVEECGQKQMIVWCQFHWEIDQIVRALSEIGIVSQLHGRILNEKRADQLDDFLSGKSRFLVAHPASAAHGLTMVNCNLSVFYSLDYSVEKYQQARGRIYRNGQRNNCLYIHLIAKNSIDEDVLDIIQNKITAIDIARKYMRSKNESQGVRI